jgi:hypothetical protein
VDHFTTCKQGLMREGIRAGAHGVLFCFSRAGTEDLALRTAAFTCPCSTNQATSLTTFQICRPSAKEMVGFFELNATTIEGFKEVASWQSTSSSVKFLTYSSSRWQWMCSQSRHFTV